MEEKLPYCRACEEEAWSLHFWPRQGQGSEGKVVPFRCRSWRHAGDCREWKGAQDFVRIREAIRTRSDWTYFVLTFNQKEWPNKRELYRAGLAMWAKFRKRLTRAWGPIAYVQTWERHAKGGAHVNVLVGNPEIHSRCIRGRWRQFRRRWARPNAMECGFGKVIWVEPCRSVSEMAGYLVKLARELTGAGPKNQIPTDAPAHFRRIRASRGLLPRPIKSGLYTGRMIFCPKHAAAAIAGVPILADE